MLGSFFAALRRLSVLPLGDRPASDEGREEDAIALYPLAGLAVGVLPALGLLLGIFGLRSPLPEVLAVVALAVVTGLRHLGELGRTAEGMVSDRPALGALEVMRDARTGAIGSAAVVLVLLVKCAALVSLNVKLGGSIVGLMLAVLLAACIARWAAVMMAYYSEYARPEGGTDEPLIAGAGRREIGWALVFTAGAVLLLSLLGLGTLGFFRGVLALAGCTLAAWFAAIYFSRRFGGVTGECLGAVIEAAEVLALVLICLLPGPRLLPEAGTAARPPATVPAPGAPAGTQPPGKDAPEKRAPEKAPPTPDERKQ
jgi:adenosylcobinamide-GDP ribazoletransferase